MILAIFREFHLLQKFADFAISFEKVTTRLFSNYVMYIRLSKNIELNKNGNVL